ncbi:hypothetical protein BDY17DRAFT_312004 [Neohortaea acidophila]|uniref:Uncharacterized protein n=1 Tax=Neohortaea acidophila TaxID=245834 RepID=A0A6A6PMX2_9PEZI|nr:uncharacterized protein BDY17DRAFT_312004 [Neohortaea acidophila]KAF2481265.1 hypothetical protein BDY17DRAFT_312004 [Neohortaea acidophila]
MGNFRLLVLVSHLLGQVIRIKPDLEASPAAHHETVQQLHRTIAALENVIEEEAQVQIMLVSGARSLLNSTRILLASSSTPSIPTTDSRSVTAAAATLFLTRSRAFLSRQQPPNVDLASPFLLSWGHSALDHFYQAYARSGREEDRCAIEDLEETFHCVERRWRLAGVYTEIIFRRYVQ